MHSWKWDAAFWKKCGYFVLVQLISLLVSMGVLAFAFAKGTGLVLLSMPVLVGGCSLTGFGLWLWRSKNVFESILVYIASASLSFSFLLCAPMVVERSLSCFVFFAAVEEGSIAPTQITQEFSKSFIQKRFDDGVQGHFLEKKADAYVATPRSKLFYAVYYPVGKLTNTLSNYRQFKQTLQKSVDQDDTL